jgi:hypothetical protein
MKEKISAKVKELREQTCKLANLRSQTKFLGSFDTKN